MKIRYIDRGKGEPIVLLHGGTSSLESRVRTGVVPNPGFSPYSTAASLRGDPGLH